MSEPKLVQQKDAGGCVVACLAMVTGLPYEEIRSKVLDFDKRDSANFRDTDAILYELGFAWQQVWLYGPGNKMRDPWPPKPWADVHMAEVRMPSGNTHSVILLRNGDVLDPLNNAPSRLTNYPQVHSVRAIYQLSALTARSEGFRELEAEIVQAAVDAYKGEYQVDVHIHLANLTRRYIDIRALSPRETDASSPPPPERP